MKWGEKGARAPVTISQTFIGGHLGGHPKGGREANSEQVILLTLCKKLYIGETGRRLGDRFREHLRDVEKDDKNASKPVARHFNLPNNSKQHMVVCGLALHQGSTESHKSLEQKFIFQIGTLNPHGINERFSFN